MWVWVGWVKGRAVQQVPAHQRMPSPPAAQHHRCVRPAARHLPSSAARQPASTPGRPRLRTDVGCAHGVGCEAGCVVRLKHEGQGVPARHVSMNRVGQFWEGESGGGCSTSLDRKRERLRPWAWDEGSEGCVRIGHESQRLHALLSSIYAWCTARRGRARTPACTPAPTSPSAPGAPGKVPNLFRLGRSGPLERLGVGPVRRHAGVQGGASCRQPPGQSGGRTCVLNQRIPAAPNHNRSRSAWGPALGANSLIQPPTHPPIHHLTSSHLAGIHQHPR